MTSICVDLSAFFKWNLKPVECVNWMFWKIGAQNTRINWIELKIVLLILFPYSSCSYSVYNVVTLCTHPVQGQYSRIPRNRLHDPHAPSHLRIRASEEKAADGKFPFAREDSRHGAWVFSALLRGPCQGGLRVESCGMAVPSPWRSHTGSSLPESESLVPVTGGRSAAVWWAGRWWTSEMTHGQLVQGHHDSERHRGRSPVNGRDEVNTPEGEGGVTLGSSNRRDAMNYGAPKYELKYCLCSL